MVELLNKAEGETDPDLDVHQRIDLWRSTFKGVINLINHQDQLHEVIPAKGSQSQ